MRSLLLVLVCVVLPPSAFAQDFGRNGFYVGLGGLGASYTKFADELEDQLNALGYVASIDTDIAGGFELYAGYRLHPHIAVEAEFNFLAKADVELDGFGDFAELESWALTGNLKAFLLSGRIQPFVLAGMGAMEAELEDSLGFGASVTEAGFVARFGGGLDFYLTRNLVVTAGVDYVLPTGDLEDLDFVAFGGGLQIRF